MDIEFHYHINLIVARLAGFSEGAAHIIATSSQFVDDNSKVWNVSLESAFYTNIITQTLNLNLPKKQLREIYTCFHFQPGDGLGITKANSPLARAIFFEALKSKNPYMIGIASHVFADTYAHQNFIGYSDPYNNPIGIAGVPNYGHMYYLNLPDLIGVKWFDLRTGHTIDNNKRFTKAASKLFKHYCYHNKLDTNYIRTKNAMLVGILEAIFAKRAKLRIKQYHKIYVEFSGSVMLAYHKQKWQRQAMYYSAKDGIYMGTYNFENSHWHNFQEQAKTYKALALRSIREYVEKYKVPDT